MRVTDVSTILDFPLDESLSTTSYLGQTYALTLGDFDANGRLDLFLNHHNIGPSVLLLDFAFGRKDSFRIDFDARVDEHGATFFDVDQDGDLDLIDTAGGRQGTASDPNDPATWNYVFKNEGGVLDTDSVAADIGLLYPLSRTRMLVPVNFDGEIGLFDATGVRPDRLWGPTFFKLQPNGDYTEWSLPGIVLGTGLFGLTAHLGTDNDADFLVYDGDGLLRIFEKGANGVRYAPTRIATGDGLISDIGVADFDGDLRPEILLGQDGTASNLYRENANGVWQEIGAAAGLDANLTGTHGLSVGDFDNDGDQDFATLLDRPGLAVDFWINDGSGRFTLEQYVDATVRGRGQNMASGDFDNDGLIDFIFGTGNGSGSNPASAGEYVVLKSLAENDNNWLGITLKGIQSETSGLGARVYLTTPDGRTQLLEQDSGAHDWMQDDSRLHFGLGDANRASIRIVWPDGYEQTERNIGANQYVVITENRGLANGDDYRDTVDGDGPVGTAGNRLAPAEGSIDYAGDVDLFATRLIDGLTYRVAEKGAASGAGTLRDPLLTLLDTAGRVVGINDDNGGTRDSAFDYTADYTGVHFVGAGAAAGRGTYEVAVGAGRGSNAGNFVVGTQFSDNIQGAGGNDIIRGGAGLDRLFGGNGNDRIDGGRGGDLMAGQNGNDWYFTDNPNDRVVERAGAGTDTIFTTFSRSLVAHVENLTLEGAAGWGIGNGLDNVIRGNARANALRGEAGNDVLHGGGGNDRLTGGAGVDHLVGGGGRDRFVFTEARDRDFVHDFQRGVDKLVLSSIDANVGSAGDQAFAWIGGAAFSGRAGQLRYDDGIVSGDVNGDRVADFTIDMVNHTALGATDFIL